MGCAYDPRKNPKCDTAPTIKPLWEQFVTYKKMKFNYPITKQGLKDGMFVLVPGGKDRNGELSYYNLYLRYSKRLLASMKPSYAKELRSFWCKHGEEKQEKMERMLDKKGEENADAMSHRIGDPFKIKRDHGDIDKLEKAMKKSMSTATHKLKPLDSKKSRKDDDDDEEDDDDDDDDRNDDDEEDDDDYDDDDDGGGDDDDDDGGGDEELDDDDDEPEIKDRGRGLRRQPSRAAAAMRAEKAIPKKMKTSDKKYSLEVM